MTQSTHPQTSPSYYPPPPATIVGSESRQWAALSHAGSFLAAWVALGLLCPLIIVLAKGRDRFVRHHAYESLNFQLNALLWIGVSVVLMPVLIGFALIGIVGLWYLVFVIRASIAANNGEWYRYPMIFRLLRP